MRTGPFAEEDFPGLPDHDWTLLVQAVDQFVPEVAQLLEQFRFLPSWRIDDVMISYAAPGGGVGPHFDNYDVFLLQGHGRRRWKVGQMCSSDSPLREHADLRILAEFEESAEWVLEPGDMLYLPPGTGLPIRVHGAFVSDDEVHRVVEAWKARGAPDYIEDILAGVEEAGSGFEGGSGEGGGEGSEEDPLYDEAVRFVTESRRASISAVQRKLKIGYNRAARMIEAMEMAGVVTSMNTNGSREVIAPPPMRD